VSSENNRENSPCCGGSLANLSITPGQRQAITDAAYHSLTAHSPDYIVTACPLCKKTFAAGKRDIPVIDIAEALVKTMALEEAAKRKKSAALAEAVP